MVGLSTGVASLAAGAYHTCALTTAGGVKCWGAADGRLGDGTSTTRVTPVNVVGLSSGVAQIFAGHEQTCAVMVAGGAKCWGVNSQGELGDGTTLTRLTPVDVVGLGSGVARMAAGYKHTCALTTAGGVKCWGWNSYGQLGDGTTTDRLTPVDVSGLSSGVASLTTGLYVGCVVTTNGAAKCWGRNNSGQVGDGTTEQRNTPVEVSGLTTGVAKLSGGDGHTCALTTVGGVKCWGWNSNGQLGDGTTTARLVPVSVVGLSAGVSDLKVGQYHVCAQLQAGVKCWGWNQEGQIGANDTIVRRVPTDVLNP